MRMEAMSRPNLSTAGERVAHARCPRCGYDLHGAIGSWREACPLSGTCVECGLEFRWKEIFRETIPPRWCVESPVFRYSDRWRAPLLTLLRTFWPWRFWSSLQMSHESNWRAIGGYLASVGFMVYVVFCLAHGALAWTMLTGGTAWTPPGLSYHWTDIAIPILLPLSDSPLTTTGVSSRDLFNAYWIDVLPVGGFFLTVHVLCAAGFLALPVSRKTAKVRWSHIFRVTLYGLGLLVPPACLLFPAVALVDNTYQVPSVVGHVMLTAAAGLALLFFPMEIVWWSTATGRYMRIPHAWGVGASVVTMSAGTTMLGATVIVLMTQP